MGFNQLLIIFHKRLKIIIGIPVLVSLATFIVFMFAVAPVYESFSTLYIINKNNDSNLPINYDNVLVNQQLIKDYRELVTSRLVTKAALDELKIKDMTPDMLAKKISVDMKTDTRVLEIRVRDADPSKAKQLTDAVSTVFVKKAVDLMNVNNVNIIDSAEILEKPVGQSPAVYAVLSFFLSFMASLGVVYLIELLNDTIKSAEDVEAVLSLNVIGIIPLTTIK
jgi:capsular polysaccharide biosynthesis protein